MPLNRFPNSASIARRARKMSGMSQDVLGEKLGYKNGQFISNCDRGLCAYPPKHFEYIADLAGVGLEDVIEARLADKRLQIQIDLMDAKKKRELNETKN